MKTRYISMEAALLLGFLAGIAAFFVYRSTTVRSISGILKEKTQKHVDKVIPPEPTPTDYCLDVPVLFYHHIQPLTIAKERWEDSLSVDPTNFERHIVYLQRQGYTLISLSALVDALHNRTKLEKSVVLMADDGYQDNYTYAYPIIKRHKVPFTIAMVTGFSGKISPYTKPDEPKEFEFMSWTEIKKMQESGYVDFLSHSWSHQSLHQNNTKKIDEQVAVAQKQLEEHLDGIKPIFIYPYGRYGDTVISILKKYEYEAAFSTDKGTQHCLSNIYTLPRLRVGNAGPSVYGL